MVFHRAVPHFKGCYCSSYLPFTSSHHPIYQHGESNKRGGGAFGKLVALSLTGIASPINCGASSFVGVDSLDKRRCAFSLGRPSFQRLLLLLLPPINLCPSPNYHHFLKKQSLITPLVSHPPSFLWISQGNKPFGRHFFLIQLIVCWRLTGGCQFHQKIL